VSAEEQAAEGFSINGQAEKRQVCDKGKDLLSGKVRLGLCRRLMAIDENGQGRKLYRCHYPGRGCKQPGRTHDGLLRAAGVGRRPIGDDEQLQKAIRKQLERARKPAPEAGGGPARRSLHAMDQLEGQRRKLLRLHHDDRIGAHPLAEEEARIARVVEVSNGEMEAARLELEKAGDVQPRFEGVAPVYEHRSTLPFEGLVVAMPIATGMP
jgi:hypothetical protein